MSVGNISGPGAFLAYADSGYQYDLSDLKPNDWNQVRALAQCQIDLEDIQLKMYNIPSEGGQWDMIAYTQMSKMINDLVKTISDIQNDLQITRKVRKEKSVDDIAQYIQKVRRQAKDLYDRKTIVIKCEKCSIELARFWLNFPNVAQKIAFESECWRCKEKVIYVF